MLRVPRSVRLGLLLALLAGVMLYAWRDVSRRRERNAWERTLDVALVIAREGQVDEAAANALCRRVPALSARLGDELRRYRAKAPPPFAFTIYGPGELREGVPRVPDQGLWQQLKHAWALRRFTANLDEALGVPTRGFDARIYLVVKPASDQASVEGLSEHGGRRAIALAELDADTVDTALFVAAHELLHTLGANDHYGPDGRLLVPDGLAEPSLTPLYPQRYAEIMARNRALSPTEEARPTTLAELRVGEATAREIGWLR